MQKQQDTKISVELKAYYDAKNRCTNPNHKRFPDWGGRGIEFLFGSFEDFYNVVGPRPPGFSLDRIDNNGPYSVDNIKWSSRVEQQHNRRKVKHNKTGVTGVREVKAKGLKTKTWQAYVNYKGKFIQLYTGPSFELACKARRDFKPDIGRYEDIGR